MSLPKVPGGGTAGVGMRGLPAALDTEGRLANTMMRWFYAVPRGKKGMEAGLSIRHTLARKHVLTAVVS